MLYAKGTMHPPCYISIVTYIGVFYYITIGGAYIINESRRVARYCFECAERDIFVEANERKKGRRDKVLEPFRIQSRKQEVLQKGPAPSIFRKLVVTS